ncbi:patatin-like phospholipase family protein [Ideonella sp.]|uniref:patatin-like phospholipase family protein n=1 Tax=Ideonella sp. TaxID=1929293 RepID=UPI003BB6494B
MLPAKASALAPRSLLDRVIAASLLVLLGACTTVRPDYNAPLPPDMPRPGYRMSALPATAANGNELFLATSFSGGGARAAAFAYGVLQGMRETTVELEGQRRTMLNELDIVSGVSGGSWAAAYLALHGEAMFPAFHEQVLMRDLQSAFIQDLLSPANLGWTLSDRYGRGDVLAAFFDREIFRGARYADLLAQKRRPWLSISATDMSLGSRFEFVQDQFDMLCSDLGSVHLSTAVAASSAVPIALSPITLKNHPVSCPLGTNAFMYGLFGDRKRSMLVHQATTYQDKQARPFVHLLDGGLADNLATRGAIEAATAMGGIRAVTEDGDAQGLRWLVFVVVNAEGSSGLDADRSDRVPSILRVTNAVADIPLGRYSSDSQELLREALVRWSGEVRTADGQPLRTYYIEVSLQDAEAHAEAQGLSLLPTALSLPPADVARVIEAGRSLFRRSPELARLLQDLRQAP